MENEDDNGDNYINYKYNDSSKMIQQYSSSSSCPSSAGLSSSSSLSSSTISSLQALDSFDKTRCLYVVGYRFQEFVEKLKESTKISFQVIDESEYYGIIHFECGMKTNKINVINQTNGLGLKFYASKRIRKQNCLVELVQLGLALAEEKRNTNNNQIKLFQRENNDVNAISGDQQFENELFFELSHLLLMNLDWGMSDLYSHVMESSDYRKKVTAAIVLSSRESLFKQILNSRQQYASVSAVVNLPQQQQQQQQFSFVRNQELLVQASDNNQTEECIEKPIMQQTSDNEQQQLIQDSKQKQQQLYTQQQQLFSFLYQGQEYLQREEEEGEQMAGNEVVSNSSNKSKNGKKLKSPRPHISEQDHYYRMEKGRNIQIGGSKSKSRSRSVTPPHNVTTTPKTQMFSQY
ncbi:hypothetical protein ABPG72_008497 [Tetrahymena utriculariae]